MTAQEFEKKTIDSLKGETGKDLQTWLKAIKASGVEKRNDVLNWLKKEQGLNHGKANTITAIYFNSGKPVYQDGGSLKDALFEKKSHLRPLYDELEKTILNLDREVKLIEKKLYVSFNGKREFAVASIKSKEIRVGMDLGDMPFNDHVLKATSLGAMPRISHMVALKETAQIDEELIDLLLKAYDWVHDKKQPT